MMFKRLREIEAARNQQDWQALNIPTLGAKGMVLPASFRLGNTLQDAQDARILLELSKADVSLATCPFVLDEPAQDYLLHLPANCLDEPIQKNETARRRFGLGRDVYYDSHKSFWSKHYTDRSPEAFTDTCGANLKKMLPAHNGRAGFVSGLQNALYKLATVLGAPQSCSIAATSGWMPAPGRLRPHHDFGEETVRVFFNLSGTTTIVIAPKSLPTELQKMREINKTAVTTYSSFNELVRQGVQMMHLPTPSISAWRVGKQQNTAHNNFAALPHSFPPHVGSTRFTGFAVYPYAQLEKATGLSWRPALSN